MRNLSATGTRHTLRSLAVPVLTVLGLAMVPDTSTAQTKVKVQTVYYAVGGNTARSLYASMKNGGPIGNRGRAFGTTEGIMQPFMDYQQRGGACRIGNFRLNVSITMHLPRLDPGQKVSPALRADWNNLAAYVRHHENHHKTLFLACADRISKRILAIRPAASCAELRAMTAKIGREEHLHCARLHNDYDRQETPRLKNLPLVREALKGNAPAISQSQPGAKRKSSLLKLLGR